MAESQSSSFPVRALIGVLMLCVLVGGGWLFLDSRDTWPRGEALSVALRPLIDKQNTDQSLVARAILDSYLETRADASRWSGVYCGLHLCRSSTQRAGGAHSQV